MTRSKNIRENYKINLVFIENLISKISNSMKKCDLCHKSDKLHYRVKSNIYKYWIFCCKECWNVISKQNDYSYGGTRKSK